METCYEDKMWALVHHVHPECHHVPLKLKTLFYINEDYSLFLLWYLYTHFIQHALD